jgi:hypothetical protein
MQRESSFHRFTATRAAEKLAASEAFHMAGNHAE